MGCFGLLLAECFSVAILRPFYTESLLLVEVIRTIRLMPWESVQ